MKSKNSIIYGGFAICVIALVSLACGQSLPATPPPSSPIVSAPEIASPTPATTVTSDIAWKTYQNGTYGFTFEYPAIYDEPAYKDSCGLKESSDGVQLGHQIQIQFLDSGGLNLAEYTTNLLQSKGWSADSQQNEPVNGMEAVTVQYRFGGTNRFGTLTLVKPNDHIFAFNFTAGSFCDISESQTSEPNAYSHIIETFQLNK